MSGYTDFVTTLVSFNTKPNYPFNRYELLAQGPSRWLLETIINSAGTPEIVDCASQQEEDDAFAAGAKLVIRTDLIEGLSHAEGLGDIIPKLDAVIDKYGEGLSHAEGLGDVVPKLNTLIDNLGA